MIDRDSPIPLYYQLKLYFKAQLDNGELLPGDRLPTEMELCDRFGVSRAPVRQALTELAREGLIYRRAGQGSFVAPAAGTRFTRQTTMRVLAHHDMRWMSSLEQAVLQWNDLYPEKEIRLDVKLCARRDFHQLLQRLTIQGEAPDLVPLDFVWIQDYAREGYISSLHALNSGWADQIVQALEVPVLCANVVQGQLFGVPIQVDIAGLWYRKDWFADEDLSPPQTWDEWLDALDHFAAPKVKERLGHRYAIALPLAAEISESTLNLLMPFFWMSGGELADDHGEVVFRNYRSATCRALRFLQEITVARRSYLPEDAYRLRWWDLIRFFAQGDAPMLLGGSCEWPRIQEESAWGDEDGIDEHVGLALLPRPSEDAPPVSSLGGTSWAISSQSAVKELAVEMLKLVAANEVSTTFCEEQRQISPYLTINGQFVRSKHPWLSKLVPFLSHVRPYPIMPHYIRLSMFLRDLFEKTLWQGMEVETTVDQTAQALALIFNADAP